MEEKKVSSNFFKVRDYYKKGLWSEKMVRAASTVTPNPWITEEEAEAILSIKEKK